MSKVAQRLLVFFIGVPIMAGLIYFNQLNHIVLQGVVFAASIVSATELYDMFKGKFDLQPKRLIQTLAPVPALITILCALLNLNISLVNYGFVFVIFFTMTYECFSVKTFEKSNGRLLTSAFIFLYCSFLGSFISRMAFFQNSRAHLLTFFLSVFFCDSFAWLFGNLFGKTNKGYVKVSPNKSLAGFAGGLIGSVLICVLARHICPDVFTGPMYYVVIFGFILGVSAIAGDLVESLLKRSSNVKDSGHIMPGRGGLLDCMDSLLFAAPVYFITGTALFDAFAK